MGWFIASWIIAFWNFIFFGISLDLMMNLKKNYYFEISFVLLWLVREAVDLHDHVIACKN